MESNLILLSAIVFLPVLGALIVAFMPKDWHDAIRYFTLAVTVVVLAVSVLAFFAPSSQFFFATEGATASQMQSVFNVPWIPSFNIDYYMGLDGISFPLVILTGVVSVLAMGASWSITKYVKGYCVLYLLLLTGMLGVFLALDFFLFYVFWEVMLLPMYFLIGVWGGPRREYAAIKFFLYTLVGSVLMLIAVLMLYFASDLRELARASDLNPHVTDSRVQWDTLHLNDEVLDKITELAPVSLPGAGGETTAVALQRTGMAGVMLKSIAVKPSEDAAKTSAVLDAASGVVTITLHKEHATAADVVAAINGNPLLAEAVEAGLPQEETGGVQVAATEIDLAKADGGVHTFNLLALAGLGQNTKVFNAEILGISLQHWAFVLLFIGFAIKVPSVPVHTWLPDAHVEAPTPISMILAGVLLKMGGYGIIRICYPICPAAGYDLAWAVCTIGVASMVYGAFAALAQNDFKRLVAYSSVSHMGYVVLGLGVWSANAGTLYNSDYWNMGVQGAMFQMIAHGISSAGMFFMVGVIYDRVHHRNLKEFGGLFSKMPVYTALAIGIFFAGLGLPGLCGFIGEVLVVLSVWSFSYALAAVSAGVVVLTAAYILWALQRVYLGPEYKGPHEEELVEIKPRELAVAVPIFVLAIILGVFPYQTVLKYMDPTIDRQVTMLAEWTKENRPPVLKEQEQKQDKQDKAVVLDEEAKEENAQEPPADAAALIDPVEAVTLPAANSLGAAVPTNQSPTASIVLP